jgi:hypothetical protein
MPCSQCIIGPAHHKQADHKQAHDDEPPPHKFPLHPQQFSHEVVKPQIARFYGSAACATPLREYGRKLCVFNRLTWI